MRRPRFIAEQARNAKGLLGRLIAFIMARETFADNLRAIDALSVQSTDHVLDIGCGHGRSLGEIASRAVNGRAAGVDPSELMVEIAVKRNRRLVRARRVDVSVGSIEELPFANHSFDKALCVHVLYFWKDLRDGIQEIARILKPGGRLALVFRSSSDEAAVKAFPSDIYRFPDVAEVQSALVAAGFEISAEQGPQDNDEKRRSSPHLVVAILKTLLE